MNETNAGGVRRRPVGLVVPVDNEAHALADSNGRLHACLEEPFPFPFRITVADNAISEPRQASAPQVPAARTTPAVLPARANASSPLEYAS